jgi:hypothetical protein
LTRFATTMLVTTGSTWAFAECNQPAPQGVYTLYRDTPPVSGLPQMRVHVATFDAADGENYNRVNCDIARQLFMNQGVAVRYWCERGRFNK